LLMTVVDGHISAIDLAAELSDLSALDITTRQDEKFRKRPRRRIVAGVGRPPRRQLQTANHARCAIPKPHWGGPRGSIRRVDRTHSSPGSSRAWRHRQRRTGLDLMRGARVTHRAGFGVCVPVRYLGGS
jgi:hypothetical protein